MPAKNPRLTITLQPAIAAQLAELSRLTGESQSSIIADLMGQASPVFDRVIRVLSAAQQAKAELKDRMASDLEKAQAKIEKQLGIMMDDLDLYTGDLLSEVEEVKRRARRTTREDAAAPLAVADAPALTPLSNRGVRSDPKKAKSQSKTTGYVGSELAKQKHEKQAKKQAKKQALKVVP